MEQKTKVITIPNLMIRPMQGRIFCIEVEPDPIQLSRIANLILPTTIKQRKDFPTGPENIEVKLKRYFVVDVADDVSIKLLSVTPMIGGKEGKKRKLQKGDEVIPFIPQGIVGFEFPVVMDWNTNQKVLSFHYTEIAATSCSVPKE